MVGRIEIFPKGEDTRAEVLKRKLHGLGFEGVRGVKLADVYTFDTELDDDELGDVAEMLSNPVTEDAFVGRNSAVGDFDGAIEVGFLPGVTDNVGNTAREGVEDLLGHNFEGQTVYSSQVMFLEGDLSPEEVGSIRSHLSNPVIQRTHYKGQEEFKQDGGMDVVVPAVHLEPATVNLVNILDASDEELTEIGKKGILNEDGTRRGPLALRLKYMHAIQEEFRRQGRNPTDIELETLAQTWSEHCKHTIFADPIDDVKEGLYSKFIKGATNRVRRERGESDLCVSVFSDNAGVIKFDEDHYITPKVETHNSPSALDPFGGSITGIVGVNRDPMGTGLGSRNFLNLSGPFCFADPDDTSPLFKGKDFTQQMLSPRQIMDGVVEGVQVGGNCSGIPTSHFNLTFDPRFKGKPLVYVGTVGIMPAESAGRPSHEKQAQPRDYIVMVGGRVGKDGIHGATFSSEAMDSGSPSTAVQIGDPITQKKMHDTLIKEARDRGLYNSITDNGAGGLSCSVAEMAKESDGCRVLLDKVPLKYPGLAPWETWVSESQERMTLSVSPGKWNEFSDLMKSRGVEATVIGEFTSSGKCEVSYGGETVVDIGMDFLHDGLPSEELRTEGNDDRYEEPALPVAQDNTRLLHSMLGRKNIASLEFISTQYDHEVQGGSVVKPLQGKGRVNGSATVTRPLLSSKKGVVVAQGINPSYSEIDAYKMAASAIDTAIRGAVATGAKLENIALLDNFCWCSSDDPVRLSQLKNACESCYDYSVGFGTPFVSGKDSMFNDFNGFDEEGKPVKISIPPTLLITAVGVMDEAQKAVTLDAKAEGDLVYVLGETYDELGGSEYYAMQGEETRGRKFVGNRSPGVGCAKNKERYGSFSEAVDKGLVASAQSVERGGLGVALAKTAMGGRLGMDVDLEKIPGHVSREDYALFSESQGRIVVTINPEKREEFEKTIKGGYKEIGVVKGDSLVVRGFEGNEIVNTSVGQLSESYKAPFEDF